jgi:hypothetical protein
LQSSTRSSFFESLEDRRLLSVSAANLLGPRTAGATWTYQISASGKTSTSTSKVIGSALVAGIKSLEIDTTVKLSTSTSVVKDYSTLGSGGLRRQKNVVIVTGSGFSSNSSTVPVPAATELPAALSAGHTYKYVWTEKTKSVSNPGNFKTSTTSTVTYSVALGSNSTISIKVPAGTFKCFAVNSTISTKVNNTTTVAKGTIYFAVGTGAIKTITTDSHGKTLASSVLTKFTRTKAAPLSLTSAATQHSLFAESPAMTASDVL